MAAITTQPADQSAVAGATALFSVTATDATGYQWQRSTDGGITFSNLSGATSAAYTTSALAPGDSGTRYRVVVSGASNSVTSSAAQLTVTSVSIGTVRFFSGNDGVAGPELWKTDGTPAGTARVKDINPGAGNGM